MFDFLAFRRNTPALEKVLHLDHAGSSLPSLGVQHAVAQHLRREAEWGGYRAADAALDERERFYGEVARALGTTPDTIAFQPSATLAWQAALDAVRLQPGARVLVHRTAYGSNAMAFLGMPIELVQVGSTEDGAIDLTDLERKLEGASLVALTHVPTGSGLVQPAEAVGRLARAAGVPYLLDACQSAGQLPLDVERIGCDLLSATGRKYLRGPRGAGVLYVRRALLDRGAQPRHLDLTGASWTPEGIVPDGSARRFETFERHVAGQIGLGVAFAEGNAIGWDVLWTRIQQLGDGLRDRLQGLPGVTVQDDGAVRGGIVTFTVEGREPNALKAALRRHDIHVSVTTAYSGRWHMEARGLASAVRASVHAVNTVEELDRFVRRIDALRRGRG